MCCSCSIAFTAAPAGAAANQLEHHIQRMQRQLQTHRRAELHAGQRLRRLERRQRSIRTGEPRPSLLLNAERSTTALLTRKHLQNIERMSTLARAQRRIRRSQLRHQRVIDRLRRTSARAKRRLDVLRPIGVCPVPALGLISDDFGAAHRHEGQYHPHEGNDITASFGAPVLAPFDGTVTTAPSGLGGLAVKIYGDAGYVYSAHLSRYGQLGPVSAGAIIGYVGQTGNATGPHDHFEWHPGNGPAVDPHSSLLDVC